MSQSLASSQFGVRPAIDSLASLDPAADKLAYYTDVDAAALADLSAFARTVLDDVDAAAVRTTIGAGTGSGDMLGANNLSDVADAATSRTNLGLGNVDNTSDANKPVSTAQQTALNLKANIASPTFTGTVTIPTPFTLGAVSVLPTGTELNFVDGVTSGIQGQIDGKQPLDTQLTSVAALAYAGNALKVVRVNAGETDFELTTPAVGTVTNVTGTAPIASSGGATPAISLNTAGVTFAKIQDIATDSLIGRDTAGSGVPENILLNATLSMDGSGNLQRAALSGDVTASAGSNSTTIAAGAVTEAKQTLADNTTADVSSTKHGYAPKSPADASKFLDGSATAAWSRPPVALAIQFTTWGPSDGQTTYFGNLPTTPINAAPGQRKIYIRQAGTVTKVELYTYATATVGTNENWTMAIGLNNTSYTTIATVGAATAERVFSVSGLSIAVVAGDYLEIRSSAPTWATNPSSVIGGGYIWIQ